MRRIHYHQYGGPETMRLEEFTLPPLQEGEVAVTVAAASVNPIDWKLRQGQLKMMTGRSFPRAMGSDFTGVVHTVGPGVTQFTPGDHVYGIARLKESGAFAETVITTESMLASKPAELSVEQAACLPTAAVMAWNGLVDRAHRHRPDRRTGEGPQDPRQSTHPHRRSRKGDTMITVAAALQTGLDPRG